MLTVLLQDGSSFLQIPEWTDGTTVLRSVTLLGGTCSSQNNAAAFLQPAGGPAASSVSGNGCNVRTVYNSTLVSTLKADGSVFTKQLLLVLLVSNATLGYGLQPWAIDIERPVMVAGLFGVPTSVDFGMVGLCQQLAVRHGWMQLLHAEATVDHSYRRCPIS